MPIKPTLHYSNTEICKAYTIPLNLIFWNLRENSALAILFLHKLKLKKESCVKSRLLYSNYVFYVANSYQFIRPHSLNRRTYFPSCPIRTNDLPLTPPLNLPITWFRQIGRIREVANSQLLLNSCELVVTWRWFITYVTHWNVQEKAFPLKQLYIQ